MHDANQNGHDPERGPLDSVAPIHRNDREQRKRQQNQAVPVLDRSGGLRKLAQYLIR